MKGSPCPTVPGRLSSFGTKIASLGRSTRFSELSNHKGQWLRMLTAVLSADLEIALVARGPPEAKSAFSGTPFGQRIKPEGARVLVSDHLSFSIARADYGACHCSLREDLGEKRKFLHKSNRRFQLCRDNNCIRAGRRDSRSCRAKVRRNVVCSPQSRLRGREKRA